MALYECVYIARQDISANQVDGLTETFTKIVDEHGGSVAKAEYWGLRNLAYRIKKNRKGHYTLLNLDAPSDALREMERTMRLNEDVLRYLTVRVDALEEGPSIVMQNRSERAARRGDRGWRGDRDRDRSRGDGPRGPRAGSAEPRAPRSGNGEATAAAAAKEAPPAPPRDETKKGDAS